ncbi:UDP-N-acetylmuramoyl-tripeptide--D-alanyl-D-alanine ligase [Aquibaculum sediminis]|uniref:UDP-N-acetylmuramoyl-tripeptide--D-alanyl-D- alanine ligase n=1 Tax=Aquibaculum sediminis TaxID=3231907 RepID=UPI003452028E
MSAEILWTAAEAKAATNGTGPDLWRATGVSIDTRSIAAGDLFVALSGPNYDAHAFVGDALAKGAAAAVVSRLPEGLDETTPLLLVPDCLAALRDLGRAARARSQAKVIAVTGSSGKTSTKELLAGACAALGPTHAAAASYNNQWGVPLTLARLPRSAAWAVCEIGMNHAGEIRPLAALVRPHVAVITNIGVAHLEYLGSREAIADAKAEIFEGLEPGATAVLPRGDDFYERLSAAAEAAGADILTFGAHPAADLRLVDYQAEDEGGRVEAEVQGRPLRFSLPFAGRHQAGNALAALAAVRALGGDVATAARALEGLEPLAGRGARQTLVLSDGRRITLLDESYNANPLSVSAALSVLGDMTPQGEGRRIAVLGDMLELGPEAGRLHRALADNLSDAAVDAVFLCGPLMAVLAEALEGRTTVVHAPDSAALAPQIPPALRDGDVVLVKGSLGSKMKRVVDALTAASAAPRGAAKGSKGGRAHAL